ncbi:arylamine N-acetyltransferase [Bradyrhizobium sp. Leo121]|uniref:arylamine N-acetyltransferase n=1 Tax=Bradyrhizobium sp. Leo121 TaxID=1571195 RepID=UPI0010291C71|nr:arylamine N-acetyltransferase [Bradyrhizobium sp. Leo121]RZN32055.1 hypothetical protein CWO90_15060 [Bradyrhizobium sp. Leo121]
MPEHFQLDHYLARIGFAGSIKPDWATLSAIHAAHVNAIPFEGLNPLLRRPVRLDLASLQQKLVYSRLIAKAEWIHVDYRHHAIGREITESSSVFSAPNR